MEIINNMIDDGGENVLSPINVELVREIYKEKNMSIIVNLHKK